MDAERIASRFEKRVYEVTRRLRRFRAEPTAANVHDLRTAIRQFIAADAILTRRLRRSGAHMEFKAGCRNVFKLTTVVRDLDVVVDRLGGEEQDGRLLSLVDELAQDRAIHARSCKIAAEALLKARRPTLLPSSLSTKKLDRRIRKRVARLSNLIDDEAKVVLEDEADEAALHRLRKHCKELRYAMQFADTDQGDASLLGILEGFQDDLGAIHDEDAIISSLRQLRGHSAVRRILEGELRRRHQNYLAFCASFRARLLAGPKVPQR